MELIDLLYIALFPFVMVYALWFFYLAIMNLKRAKDSGRMTKLALFFALPIAVTGFILDVVVNVTVGTVMFLEFPHYKRLTLSQRMSYHYDPESTTWRSRLANFFARNLMDDFNSSLDKPHIN